MLGFISPRWRARVSQAVQAGDAARVGALLAGRRLPARLAAGPDGLVRHAIRNEDDTMLSVLLDAGAALPAHVACYMALWVERVERAHRDGHENALARHAAARRALVRLHRAGPDWEATLPSLGSGDSARTVIDHAWPGVLDALGASASFLPSDAALVPQAS